MILAGLLLACQRPPEGPPTLQALASLPEDRAGAWLMAGSGAVRLDPEEPHAARAVVAVHGYESEGVEWVAPLTAFGAWDADVWFYRWSWQQCPRAAAAELDAALDGLAADHPDLAEITVVAHSYGGLVAAVLGQRGTPERPTRLELVAAPLAGHPLLDQRCPGEAPAPDPAAAGFRWRQWRTEHAADGAFRDLPTDPQVVALPDLEVVALPAAWDGGRLGHNRSLSFVAGRLGEPAAP